MVPCGVTACLGGPNALRSLWRFNWPRLRKHERRPLVTHKVRVSIPRDPDCVVQFPATHMRVHRDRDRERATRDVDGLTLRGGHGLPEPGCGAGRGGLRLAPVRPT